MPITPVPWQTAAVRIYNGKMTFFQICGGIRSPQLKRFLYRLVDTTLMLLSGLLFTCTQLAAAEQVPGSLRRPVGLAVSRQGDALVVANRDSGSVSLVDLVNGKVMHELSVGGRLSHLAAVAEQDAWLLTDTATNELIVIKRQSNVLTLAGRLTLFASPVDIVVSPAADKCYITTTWAHRICVVDIHNLDQPQLTKTIDVSFAPREQLVLEDQHRLLVADAFGGNLAFIDTTQDQLISELRIHANNIRGLALSPHKKQVLIAHQILFSSSGTTAEGVHWGTVLKNVVESIPITALATAGNIRSTAADILYLGHPDRAAGDPTGLRVTRDRRQILTFAGLNEIAISEPDSKHFTRIPVGQRPLAIALNRDHEQAYVANMFSDSLTVIDINSATVEKEISLGMMRKRSSAERGEAWFHDARLSSDGWYSCHSCHTDGHSNGALNDNFGDHYFGSPKRILSLLGVAETGPWAWDGNVDSLSLQIRKSIETTMQGSVPSDQVIRDLSAYLQTLSPPPALIDARKERQSLRVSRGSDIFNTSGCSKCHEPPRFTSTHTWNVGLQDKRGNASFNPPSLRGVSHRRRLFHDNRAHSLHEVLVKFRHGSERSLSSAELSDLIYFLQSL